MTEFVTPEERSFAERRARFGGGGSYRASPSRASPSSHHKVADPSPDELPPTPAPPADPEPQGVDAGWPANDRPRAKGGKEVEAPSREELEALVAEERATADTESEARRELELEITALREAHERERLAFATQVRQATDLRLEERAKSARERTMREMADKEAARIAALEAAASNIDLHYDVEARRAAEARRVSEVVAMMRESELAAAVRDMHRHHTALLEHSMNEARRREAAEADAAAYRALYEERENQRLRAELEREEQLKLQAELKALRARVKNEGVDDVFDEARALREGLRTKHEDERTLLLEDMTKDDAEAALRLPHDAVAGWSRLKVNEALTWRSRGAGLSRLHEAAVNSRFDEARLLLVLGAEVNALTATERQTPLHKAAFAGSWDVCQLLLKHHADVNATDAAGSTAAEYAERRQHVDIAARLRGSA